MMVHSGSKKNIPNSDEVVLYASKCRQEKVDRLVRLLCVDARMPLTELSMRTGIPVSTIFDLLQEVRRFHDIRCVFVRKAEVAVAGGGS